MKVSNCKPECGVHSAAAARRAFKSYSQTTREERLEVLGRILAEYQKRFGDLATAVTEEMGAPASLAQRAHAPAGMGHLVALDESDDELDLCLLSLRLWSDFLAMHRGVGDAIACGTLWVAEVVLHLGQAVRGPIGLPCNCAELHPGPWMAPDPTNS